MKVLVVEDEHRIATYIKKGLELKAYVVDVVFDGEAGLEMATVEQYDVIVLDRMVPKLDGISVCMQLRNDGIHTPILMLTAKSQIDDRVEGLNAGADDYLVKPFAFVELLARIKALTRRPKESQNDVLKTDNLTLNTGTFDVFRSNTKIDLSKKEYELLEFLLRNKGQLFTKDQLTEQVWSYESEVLPNTAQVYIGYLRNKIDRAFPKELPLITTVRGFGYKMEAA
jgi:DNA-binding response OmpR family regulator